MFIFLFISLFFYFFIMYKIFKFNETTWDENLLFSIDSDILTDQDIETLYKSLNKESLIIKNVKDSSYKYISKNLETNNIHIFCWTK